MKTIPAALQAHYDSGSTTIAYALKITRLDGEVYGFTSAAESVYIGGVLYDATQGLEVSNISYTDGLEVSNLELTTLDDGSLFTQADVLGNVWQGAAFELFCYNYTSPSDGLDYKLRGNIGGVKLSQGTITIEFRSLQQYLQQPIGVVTSRTCRARFADYPEPNQNARCRLNVAQYTDSLIVTSVVSQKAVIVSRPSGVGRPDAWYENGFAVWMTGNNAGIRVKVRAYSASPTLLEFVSPLPRLIQAGDAINAIAGCRKRLEDCKAFGNVLNFQAEPNIIGTDALTAPPNVL